MLNKFQNHISTHFSYLEGKRLLLAVSGGLDSMVLAHLSLQLGLKFSIAHCNFMLRNDESDKDEVFVKSFCDAHNIKGYFRRFETEKYAEDSKLSVQMAARKLRYEWFYELLEKEGFDYIVTAHHLDDTLETFLINVSRGTGLEGLTGIPAENDKIIRPLLIFSREEIENYARKHQLQWREDSSNASDKYLRNKIRHQVVPVFKEMNSGFLNSFQNTLQHLQQAKSMAEDASHIVYEKVVTEADNRKIISLDELLPLKNYQAYLYHWLSDYGFSAWEDVYKLAFAQSGKMVFSENFRLLKDRNTLILEPKNENTAEVFFIEKEQKELIYPIKISLDIVDKIAETGSDVIYVDKDTLKFPLILRRWQEGDYFYPFGMKGRKKLSKFFKDEKFSLSEKEKIWLLCSDNQIIWVVGKRFDDRFKVTPNTKNIIKIALLP